MKKLHLIWAHPRQDSLTAKVVNAVKQEAQEQGFEVSEWEPYSVGFNPILSGDDEPDWSNTNKSYSEEATLLARELQDKDFLVFVFPIWWYSLPAILKGYIDRVWNYGVFYGNRDEHKLPVKAVRWIGLIGSDEAHIQKRNYDKYMQHYFNIGLAGYCGIENSKLEILYNTIGDGITDFEEFHQQLITQATTVIQELK